MVILVWRVRACSRIVRGVGEAAGRRDGMDVPDAFPKQARLA